MEKINNNNFSTEELNNSKQRHEDLLRYRKASKHGYQPGSHEEIKFMEWERNFDERSKKIEKQKESISSGKEGDIKIDDSLERIENVINCIDKVTLVSGIEDVESVALLEGKKKQARGLIRRLLEDDVVNYVSCVKEFNKARVGVQNKDIDKDIFVAYDRRRTIKHNSLIDSVRIVSRFIRNNFGLLSEEDLDEYEESINERGEVFLELNRVSLHSNVICPDYIDVNVREDITDWALEIYSSLAKIDL